MSRRVEMVQDQIKEEISRLLRFKAKDPRFGLGERDQCQVDQGPAARGCFVQHHG